MYINRYTHIIISLKTELLRTPSHFVLNETSDKNDIHIFIYALALQTN